MKVVKFILLLFISLAFLYKCSKDGGNSESFSGTGLSGSTARFAINGNHLFTVDNRALHSFSLATGAHPMEIGAYQLGANIETIFSLGNSLLIGAQTGMHIVNVSNPASPFLSSTVEHFTSCDPVVADNNYAYLTISNGRPRCFTGGANQLMIYDISTLSAPQLRNTVSLFQPNGLALDGKWLFVCDQGIKMFDRSNPTAPLLQEQKTGFQSSDCIAANNLLTISSNAGIYQYSYAGDSLHFLSQIPKALPAL